jgi:glycosyltransferase involved in cell wall biosynthesis
VPESSETTWFETTAPLLAMTGLAPHSNVFVFPENHAGMLEEFRPWPNRKVVFCQNPFLAHRGLGERADYRDFGVQDVLCPAYQVAAFCRRRFPALNTWAVPCPIDRDVFRPREPKRLQVAYAPRKRPLEAACVRDLFRAENPPFRDVPWVALAQMGEKEVARVLGESALFLSLCRFEAAALTLLEALASGCAVAGFTGQGPRDYTTAANGFWAAEDDCLDCAHQLALAARLVVEGGNRYRDLRGEAERTAACHSRERFRARLAECWRTLAADTP